MFERLRLSTWLQRGWMATALCLVLLQSVVNMHRVLHFSGLNASFAATQLTAKTSAVAEPEAGSVQAEGHKGGVWGDHTRASDCQLLDQACADATPAAMWRAPSLTQKPRFTLASLHVSWVNRVLFFSARGPPVVC